MKKTLTALLAGAALALSAQAAKALDEITVAYFLEWPMPFQFAKVQGIYDQAMGVKVHLCHTGELDENGEGGPITFTRTNPAIPRALSQ